MTDTAARALIREFGTGQALAPRPHPRDDDRVDGAAAAGRVVTVATRALMAAAVVLAALGILVVVALPSGSYRVADVVLGVLYLSVPAVGALMVRAQHRNAAGWVLLVGGVGFLVKNTLNAYADSAFAQHAHIPGAYWAAWVSQLGSVGAFAVASVGVLLFPDGHLPGPRWRWTWWLVGIVLGGLLLKEGAPTFGHWDVANPTAVPVLGDAMGGGLILALVLAPVLLTVSAWALHVRVRSASTSPYRSGLLVVSRCAWLGAGAQWACLFLGGGGLTSLIYVFERIAVVVLAFAAWYAVLRYKLFDLRLVLSRSLAYLALSGVVGGAYVGVLASARAVIPKHNWTLLAVVIAALVALPLRDLLQTQVNRLVYGQTRDPYRALSAVGDQLGAVAEPESALPVACAALARSLRLPFAAVEVDGETVARCGDASAGPVIDYPLVFAGERVGTLLLVLGRERLSTTENMLLSRLTVQIALAARAASLNDALRGSRERLVALREAERLRIRRDLHDGLGPTLAGIVLGLEQARTRIIAEPEQTAATLAMLSEHAQAAVTDVRAIVHNLRPPALDDLGLPGALAEEARRLGVSAAANGHLPPLAPAVEVALYRIGLEAMTNARRHAGDAAIWLELTYGVGERHVELAITDDGLGISPSFRAGIGISSMRERAAELGGTCSVVRRVPRGTAVIARLPVSA